MNRCVRPEKQVKGVGCPLERMKGDEWDECTFCSFFLVVLVSFCMI